MTGPFLLGVGASFLAGSFGYVLFRFWLKPLLRYRRAKKKVVKALDQLSRREGKGLGELTASTDKASGRESIRQLGVDLSACYNEQLPDWYRLLLQRRGESPLEASAYLMKLSNTRNSTHALRQVDSIRQCLNAV